MAADEMTWRKLPRNIITDPTMDYIASRLPPEYASAPYMFYIVAMSLADDDGIFDLEDGIIFGRLMHVSDPSIVAQTANLMLERKIIVRAGHTTKCMITEWGYSSRSPGRTLEQRREVVRRKMEQEKQARSEQFTKLEQQTETVIPLDFNTKPLSDDFLCPVDDKKSENVVKEDQTEKIREDKTRLDLEKNTHREDKTREIEKQQLQATAYEPSAVAEEEIQETSDNEEWEEGTESCTDVSSLADEALGMGRSVIDDEDKTRLKTLLNDFFAKNCLGYKPDLFESELNIIMERVIELSDDDNPPNIVAATLLGQFKKLTEDGGYYSGHPLRPSSLLKTGIWEHALAAASKLLLCGKPKTPAWIKQLEEAKACKDKVGDELDQTYLQYNIDPTDPNRASLLLQAQSKERARSNGP